MADADTQPDRAWRIAFAGLLALAALARVAFLARSSLWIDEIFESYLIHAPAKAFWAALRFDAGHPPLDYLVGRAVAWLHPADAWRRLPSVVWGVASIAALSALVRRRG
ncbi:MAG TPA: hypothetical protein VG777_07275, partial [Thermoanaerobaculia bacterium]|nr:hypothetical protein [Thermoanaerobaculia bacterium]